MADVPETFTCPECASVYEVTRTKLPEPDEDYAECVSCGCVMAKWNTSEVPLFRLIRTPDGRSPPEKTDSLTADQLPILFSGSLPAHCAAAPSTEAP